jgi:hypothetical protein
MFSRVGGQRTALSVFPTAPRRTWLEPFDSPRLSRNLNSEQNIAVGEQYTTENAQERAWQQGRASFRFVDVKGKQGGRRNREYVA